MMSPLRMTAFFCIAAHKNRFKNSSRVTPGTPPIAETSTESRLTGMYTPVSPDSRSTAASANKPADIDSNALLKGRLFFAKK